MTGHGPECFRGNPRFRAAAGVNPSAVPGLTGIRVDDRKREEGREWTSGGS